jgi:uncharacterized protein YjbI with pentapeptide repeats
MGKPKQFVQYHVISRPTWKNIVIGVAIVLASLFAIGIANATLIVPAWPDWTGFNGKTLWDFVKDFSGLAALLTLIYAFFRDRAEDRAARAREAKERASEREIAADQAREAALQRYIDNISKLILGEESLDNSERSRAIARARTLTVLSTLDGRRKRIVTEFLYSLGVIVSQGTVIPLNQADLGAADLGEASLSGADLGGANLSAADLGAANLSAAHLAGADLREANLSRANLSRANLSRANLSRANLSGADLGGANLSGADLSGARLSEAHLSRANLSEADLQAADLSVANLSGADLGGADLREANLSGADLSGADLRGAHLTGAHLTGAKINDFTRIDDKWRLVWEIVNQGAQGRDLSRADLSEANLRGAKLRGANLVGANLVGITYNDHTTWPDDFTPPSDSIKE